jgi:hypothetical protein
MEVKYVKEKRSGDTSVSLLTGHRLDAIARSEFETQ